MDATRRRMPIAWPALFSGSEQEAWQRILLWTTAAAAGMDLFLLGAYLQVMA